MISYRVLIEITFLSLYRTSIVAIYPFRSVYIKQYKTKNLPVTESTYGLWPKKLKKKLAQ